LPAGKRLSSLAHPIHSLLEPGRGPAGGLARSSLEGTARTSIALAIAEPSLVTEPATLAHVSADLRGIGSGPLRDVGLLSGLLIAAAGAAGLNAVGAPIVRAAPNGAVSAVLLLDPCHVSIHSLPDRGLALVDILAPDAALGTTALDVFVRRLTPTAVTSETRLRG
jgi:S-adenosylmethionine decarboxylase